ncbi:MAG TPA: glucose-6-phosphate isomerase, partial [Bacteroidales bacterium]|nr:glucose-6-phosphate isomerase [Bacteroidales bacterium]
DDVGGRYSVLTPVGLLPIAAAGWDVDALVQGARSMADALHVATTLEGHPAGWYAAARQALYRRGKAIEVLVNYEPALGYLSEWWKQLYGESEGKQQRGIFPASVSFTTDLHSMGQYLQDGLRVLFESVISIENPRASLLVPHDPEDADGLNFLAGLRLSDVNAKAELGTLLAHVDGGVPNLRIVLPRVDEQVLGELVYFFEMGCAISGYMLEVNPFDQPGVEDYKRNMFALLGKPGFEVQREALLKRLG